MLTEKASPLARAWLKAGLRFILTEGEDRIRALSRSSAQAPSRPAEVSPAIPAPPPGRFPTRGPRPTARPSASPGSPARPVPPLISAPDGLNILPPQSWPQPWVALRDRRPLPSRPLVVWTYQGLGDDLMGQPDRQRQEVIVRLLRALRHPAGTHVFWPFALPGSGREEHSLFWSGEALLRPRVLLLFGGASAGALGLDSGLALYTQHSVAGRRVIIMPPALDLALDAGLYARAFPFLERLLNFCAA